TPVSSNRVPETEAAPELGSVPGPRVLRGSGHPTREENLPRSGRRSRRFSRRIAGRVIAFVSSSLGLLRVSYLTNHPRPVQTAWFWRGISLARQATRGTRGVDYLPR